ncbi:MAG: hypothetical protein HOV68_07665, partial [Streptomycetaceae bacterium]|nr:hypothetical protein [Streptomycetaceae bacterium]
PVLTFSYGPHDTRTPAEDHTLPYALAAMRAGAEVHLHEFDGGHFMQWVPPYGGGAVVFGRQTASMEAVLGGFGPLPSPKRPDSVIAVAAGLATVGRRVPVAVHMGDAKGTEPDGDHAIARPNTLAVRTTSLSRHKALGRG